MEVTVLMVPMVPNGKDEMNTFTKKILVNGEPRQMFSMDGRTWFLNCESMYAFEKRLREVAETPSDDADVLEADMVEQPE